MRLFIGIIVYNILLIFVLFYAFFFSTTSIKMHYLNDVSNLNEEEGSLLLADYKISIVYLESDEDKSTILYTKPSANALVYEGQMITLYVSKGYYLARYKNLENLVYTDCIEYLKKLEADYQIKIIITYKKDNYLLDGLVYEQVTTDDFIEENDTLQLVVISNPKTVILPNFVGWYYKDVINFSRENNINISFEYIPILYPSDYVVGQSKEEGSMVLKNSNPITVYLAKEN